MVPVPPAFTVPTDDISMESEIQMGNTCIREEAHMPVTVWPAIFSVLQDAGFNGYFEEINT